MFKAKSPLPESSQYVIDLKEMYALRRQAEQRNNVTEIDRLTNTIVIMQKVLEAIVTRQAK